MTSNDIHGIEHGWAVKTSDGQHVGSVEETTDRYILVKTGLINASHHYLPATALAHVRPEMKEVGVALTHDQVTDGDWSQPPAEPPRSEGAPLNAEDDEEVDAIMGAATPAGPEKPPII